MCGHLVFSFPEDDFFDWIQASANGRNRLSTRELFGLCDFDESFLFFCSVRQNTFSQLDVKKQMLPSYFPLFLPLSCWGLGRPSLCYAGRFSTGTFFGLTLLCVSHKPVLSGERGQESA